MTHHWFLMPCMALVPAMAQPDAISGQEILSLVQTAMQQHSQPMPEISAPIRAFPPCDHVPEVSAVNGQWAQAELQCRAPTRWRRVLRLAASDVDTATRHRSENAPARATDKAVIVTRPLARGQRISAADVSLQSASTRLGAMREVDNVIGRRLRVSLMPDQPVLDRHLEPDHHISEGEKITVHLSQGGVEIGISAIALESGWQGDRVRVRPWNSERVVQAEIIAPGHASVRTNMLP